MALVTASIGIHGVIPQSLASRATRHERGIDGDAERRVTWAGAYATTRGTR